MKIVNHLDINTWRKFVEDHPHGNIFHSPEMFEVYVRTKGYQPTLWAAVEGVERVLALMLPVEIVANNRLPKFLSRNIIYGGVLYNLNSEGQDALSVLLEEYKNKSGNQTLFTELRNSTATTEIQPVFQKNDFIYDEHLNYLISLDCTPEELFENIGKRTRKHISRGLRKGVLKVRVVNDCDQMEVCYELIKKTYRNAQIPIAHKSLFAAAFEMLAPKNMVRFLLASVDDIPVAASVELLYKDVIYGWYSGMDRTYAKYTPSELIMWNILSWGANNGFRLYDFGGAGKPNENYGVRDFKAKFGGDLVNFGRNKYIAFPLVFKLFEFGYEKARRVLFS